MIARSTLEAHDASVRGDNPWQQRARLHQSLWRQTQGLPSGLHNSRHLGSRLDPSVAEPEQLANYLTEQARSLVKVAVDEAPKTGALLSRPRLWVDLLSSQPLCFNLFGPLAYDLPLATRALRMVWHDIREVTGIRFEWSPGRGDSRYTGNRSAFDVFIDYDGERGRSFLGIEVKYHEDMSGRPAEDASGKYVEMASNHQIFHEDKFDHLQKLPLQQIWLDHLLALQLGTNPKNDGWDWGTFMLLYPVGNVACASAAANYRSCLTVGNSFDVRTLDDVVHATRLVTSDTWPEQLYARYLDPAPVKAVLHKAGEA